MLTPARTPSADDVPVVGGHQIEEAVPIEIHGLEFVIVRVLRQSTSLLEHSAPVVREHDAARAALARNEYIEVVVVVDVDQLDLPRKTNERLRHTRGRSVREAPGSVVEPQASASSLVHHVVTGAPVGKHQVEIAVAVHVSRLGVAKAQVDPRQVRRGDLLERSPAYAQEEATLSLIGRADEDVDITIPIEISRLDHA